MTTAEQIIADALLHVDARWPTYEEQAVKIAAALRGSGIDLDHTYEEATAVTGTGGGLLIRAAIKHDGVPLFVRRPLET